MAIGSVERQWNQDTVPRIQTERQSKIDEIDYSHVMTTEELQKNYDEYKIVDVRTDEEYEGAILYDEAKEDIFREQFISGTQICSMMQDI